MHRPFQDEGLLTDDIHDSIDMLLEDIQEFNEEDDNETKSVIDVAEEDCGGGRDESVQNQPLHRKSSTTKVISIEPSEECKEPVETTEIAPTLRHYERSGFDKRILLCVILGLRFEGSDFRREPYTQVKRNIREFKPTNTLLRKEVIRRITFKREKDGDYCSIPRRLAACDLNRLANWLSDNPICSERETIILERETKIFIDLLNPSIKNLPVGLPMPSELLLKTTDVGRNETGQDETNELIGEIVDGSEHGLDGTFSSWDDSEMGDILHEVLFVPSIFSQDLLAEPQLLMGDKQMADEISVQENSSDLSISFGSDLFPALLGGGSLLENSSEHSPASNNKPPAHSTTHEEQVHAQVQRDLLRKDTRFTGYPFDGMSVSAFSQLLSISSQSYRILFPPKKKQPAPSTSHGALNDNDDDDVATIQNAMDTAKTILTDIQSFMTGVVDEDDKEVGDSCEANVVVDKEVPWDAKDEIKWVLRVLMIPTNATAPHYLAEAIELLDKISYHQSDETPKAAQVLVANGGMTWLLEFGQNHEAHALLLYKVLAAIGNVTYVQAEREARRQIVMLDGIRWLLDLSHQYKDDAIVQRCTFLVLANVASDQPEACQSIVSLGGIRWLLNVSQHNMEKFDIQVNALLVLTNVASDEPKACQQILSLDGIQWLLDVSRLYKENNAIQHYTSLALEKFALMNDHARGEILDRNGTISLGSLNKRKHRVGLRRCHHRCL